VLFSISESCVRAHFTISDYRVIKTSPSVKLLNQVLNSPQLPRKMTSLHQRLNQENEYEQESAVEMLHSRWSSSSQTFVDKPPSQPLSLRQISERPSNSPVKESYQTDPDTGNSRRGNATGKLRRLNSKLTSSSGSPPTDHHCNHSVAEEALSEGSSRVHHPRRSFASAARTA
jgi:hypothetical protein